MCKPICMAVLGVALLGPGCVFVGAAAVGAAAAYGAIKYLENGAEVEFPAELSTTWEGTVAGLRTEGFPVDPETRWGAVGGKLTFGEVSVEVEPLAPKRTRVFVKVGTFETEGNRRRARRILEAVRREVEKRR